MAAPKPSLSRESGSFTRVARKPHDVQRQNNRLRKKPYAIGISDLLQKEGVVFPAHLRCCL
jgi:hypothetical protein